jgi:16S rRNA (uracil1498-N3)-methyltransferase
MPRVKVQLFSALIKEDNYEFIVRKGTELGVSSIVPVITEYTSEKKVRLDRLRLIAVEASKQCGRAAPTEIEEAVSLDDALSMMLSADMPIAAYESEVAVYLKDILRDKAPDTISLLIGPEGGFSDAERDLIRAKGIPTFSLGKRILKAETAALSAISNIMYELDR